MGKQKMVEEAKEENPYMVAKDLCVDYRFWNVFHSNFHTSVIFKNKKSKIMKMQYIEWEELREKNDPDFNQAILAFERFSLTDIMAFRYDWNVEVLAQFHATYYYKSDIDEIH